LVDLTIPILYEYLWRINAKRLVDLTICILYEYLWRINSKRLVDLPALYYSVDCWSVHDVVVFLVTCYGIIDAMRVIQGGLNWSWVEETWMQNSIGWMITTQQNLHTPKTRKTRKFVRNLEDEFMQEC